MVENENATLPVSSRQACISLKIGVSMSMQLISETLDSERGEKKEVNSAYRFR